MAIGQLEFLGGDDAPLPRRKVNDVGVEQCVLHVGAVATGIHPNCAADRTRHTDRPLEAGEAVPDRRSSDDRQFRRCAGDHDRLVDHIDRRIVAGHVHDQTVEPSIGDEHVAATTQCHDGNARAGNGGGNGAQGLVIVDDDHGGGAAPDPIGRECTHRHVDRDLVADVVHQSFDHRNEDGVHAAPRCSSRPIT